MLRRAVLLLVTWAAVQSAFAAWRHDWTYDEKFYLEWSRRLIDARVTERQSHERFNSKTPITIPSVLAERLAVALGAGPDVSRWAARLPGTLWLLVLLGSTFALTASVFGPYSGLVAAALAACDPNLIAHASVVTVDVPYAAATVLTTWAAARLAMAPSTRQATLLGAAFGLALLTKFTGLFLTPIVLLALALAGWADGWRAVSKRVVATTATAWLVLWCGYLFADAGRRLGDIPLAAEPLERAAALMPGLVLPLPAGFVTGVDRSLVTELAGSNVILFGRRHPVGTWYYFLVLWLFKTPLAVLVAHGAGVVVALKQRRLATRGAIVIVAALLVHAVYFSLLFKTQVGYRYVLMTIPLLVVIAAAGLGPWLENTRRSWIAAAAALAACVEGALYLGNPLSFTNVAVQPKAQVFRLFADSNVDWGQNREKITRWLERRGIPVNRLDPPHPLAGTNVYGLNNVAGVWDFERHRWIRENADPVDHLGHTYLLFEIDDALYERYLAEKRTWPPTGRAEGLCSEPGRQLAPGGKQPFAFDGLADASRSWIVCVDTTRGTDLGLRAFSGSVSVGHVAEGDAAVPEVLQPDQVLWYRLEPGTHVFVARQVPNRRPWIPSPFDGEWHVRRRGARISIREIRAAGPSSNESR